MLDAKGACPQLPGHDVGQTQPSLRARGSGPLPGSSRPADTTAGVLPTSGNERASSSVRARPSSHSEEQRC
jgi:hypothetical protein